VFEYALPRAWACRGASPGMSGHGVLMRYLDLSQPQVFWCAWCDVCGLHPRGMVSTQSEGLAVDAAERHADETGHSTWLCVGGDHSRCQRWIGPSLPGPDGGRLGESH
jgi:hypothetical protein